MLVFFTFLGTLICLGKTSVTVVLAFSNSTKPPRLRSCNSLSMGNLTQGFLSSCIDGSCIEMVGFQIYSDPSHRRAVIQKQDQGFWDVWGGLPENNAFISVDFYVFGHCYDCIILSCGQDRSPEDWSIYISKRLLSTMFHPLIWPGKY